MYLLIVIVIGYLFGCLHGSQLVGKYKQMNIKKAGTKNAGATNTVMLLGWKYGLIVAVIDIMKAVLSILLVLFILNQNGIMDDAQILLIYINSFFVVLGHNYPLTMNFNGGKGTASFVGALLVIDWKVAFMGVGILLLFALTTDYLAVGVLFMYVSFLGFTYYAYGIPPAIVAFLFSFISIIKHIENYKRIFNNEEIRLSSVLRKEVG